MMRTLFLFRVLGMAYWLKLYGEFYCLPMARFLSFFFTLFMAYCFELSFIDFLCGFCLVVWLYCYKQRAVCLID
jgi:hypothetical protein